MPVSGKLALLCVFIAQGIGWFITQPLIDGNKANMALWWLDWVQLPLLILATIFVAVAVVQHIRKPTC